MCCINRQKDDLNSSSMSSVSKPVDFIRSKPGLVRVLKWFDKIEDEFKESMNDVPLPLDEIISILDDECEEEIIELHVSSSQESSRTRSEDKSNHLNKYLEVDTGRQ